MEGEQFYCNVQNGGQSTQVEAPRRARANHHVVSSDFVRAKPNEPVLFHFHHEKRLIVERRRREAIHIREDCIDQCLSWNAA